MTQSNLLTNSRMACANTCLRKHQFAYELGIRRDRTSQPLRMGSAFHDAIDLIKQGRLFYEAAQFIYDNYAQVPEWVEDNDAWFAEQQVVLQLVSGWVWRYQNSPIKIIATEQQFQFELEGTEWAVAGKIDGIVELEDGRLAVLEHKTCGEDIDPESDYWRRLRLDAQISLYMLAARALGHNVTTCVYDVVRKPTTKPKMVKDFDDKGNPIVVNEQGERCFNSRTGQPLKTADSSKGRRFLQHMETPEQYGQRLILDIQERPDYYYARQEIPRMEADLDEFKVELHQQAHALTYRRGNKSWPRNTNACIRPYKCEYFDLCCNGIDVEREVPEGFVKLSSVHPELELEATP